MTQLSLACSLFSSRAFDWLKFGPHPDPKNNAIGPKKSQNDPQNKANPRSKNRAIVRNQKLLVCMDTPPKIFGHQQTPKKSQLGPKKAQNDPNIA